LPVTAELGRVRTRQGHELVLREIRADDVEALQRGFARLTREEVRLRFLHPLAELPYPMAVSLCNLDPATAVAFVLADPPQTPSPEIHAVARAHIDPATLAAEFALVVQRRYTGQGFGRLLLQRLIEACRARGAIEMWGDVLVDNRAMLELCEHFGFERRTQWHDPGIVRVTLDLTKP
jgi:acetyltransferase